MLDTYFDLIARLKEKQDAVSEAEIRIAQQGIKQIADKLKKQPENDEVFYDAAFCYYIAGYYVHAQALATSIKVNNLHPIQKWIFYFLSKDIKTTKIEVAESIDLLHKYAIIGA